MKYLLTNLQCRLSRNYIYCSNIFYEENLTCFTKDECFYFIVKAEVTNKRDPLCPVTFIPSRIKLLVQIFDD